ncbi:hypothetical protein ABS735_29295 [Streptomyces sp. MMCC 100]|uniref:hypothetical protein n=1 Tax=Streptomyces sp. MMCC 100 TaxID=3163555 RepID=UPI00359B0AA0
MTALVLALGVGCSSSPEPDAKASPASQPPYTETSEPPSAPSPADDALGSAPDNLRQLDWARTAVPGDYCHVADPITFTAGEATVRSERWGTVHAEQYPDEVVYGDVVGDSRAEAALRVGCDTGGQTGSGRLVWAYVVFTSEEQRLRLVGTVTPQKYEGGQASSFEGIDLANGQVTARENWHRSTDASCCPSGKAVTIWRVGDDGTLKAGAPRVTQ